MSEYNANNAEVAKAVVSYAGFSDKVQIFVGKSSWELPKIAPKVGRADFVLLDHNKKLYLQDLQLMETLGIVSDDTRIAADNVIYPGAPDFLEYVSTLGKYDTHLVHAAHEVNLDASDPRGVFRGLHNTRWSQGQIPKDDAISFSTKLPSRDSRRGVMASASIPSPST